MFAEQLRVRNVANHNTSTRKIFGACVYDQSMYHKYA